MGCGGGAVQPSVRERPARCPSGVGGGLCTSASTQASCLLSIHRSVRGSGLQLQTEDLPPQGSLLTTKDLPPQGALLHSEDLPPQGSLLTTKDLPPQGALLHSEDLPPQGSLLTTKDLPPQGTLLQTEDESQMRVPCCRVSRSFGHRVGQSIEVSSQSIRAKLDAWLMSSIVLPACLPASSVCPSAFSPVCPMAEEELGNNKCLEPTLP